MPHSERVLTMYQQHCFINTDVENFKEKEWNEGG